MLTNIYDSDIMIWWWSGHMAVAKHMPSMQLCSISHRWVIVQLGLGGFLGFPLGRGCFRRFDKKYLGCDNLLVKDCSSKATKSKLSFFHLRMICLKSFPKQSPTSAPSVVAETIWDAVFLPDVAQAGLDTCLRSPLGDSIRNLIFVL